jgi:YD repeat-containing protein
LIREAAPNVYEIKALDGRGWRYEAGILTSIEHPALGVLKVVMRGGLLCELGATDAASDAPAWLAAKYDRGGRLESLTLAGVGTHHFVWDNDGRLLTWKRAEGGQVEFEYQQGLISAVKAPNHDVKKYSWAENPGYERGDSRWRWPVHLASDDTHSYRYELSHKGFVLNCCDNATGRESVSVFNPRLHRLEQRRNGETIIVTFHGGNGSMGALRRIENGQGEILEDYQYDERGLLVGVKRKGEPVQSFSYDEDGRLMALEEMPATQ